MPERWLKELTLRALPAEPGMEADCACWIPSLASWIAGDEAERRMIRSAVGPDARVMLGSELEEE